jgi:hypothetical protein
MGCGANIFFSFTEDYKQLAPPDIEISTAVVCKQILLNANRIRVFN